MASAHRPRLFDFNQERSEIIKDSAQRVLQARIAQSARPGQPGLVYVLNEAAFHAIERLVMYGAAYGQGEVGSLGYWQRMARRVGQAGEGEKQRLLKDLIFAYLTDLAGHFEPRVYTFANQVLPVGLSLLFNAQAGQRAQLERRFRRLRERVRIEGDLETLRKLAQRGTFIVAPTHVSNMDSIVVGWALHEAGLPPVTYGAGKNLFTNPLLSYFMENLGAYRVDRRIRHNLYKDCLKSYSEVLLERGFHSLFFPGGTRSRSGEVETHLKLGLLGTGLSAYMNSCARGQERPVYIIPVTINFGLCLEAEGLISDYLRSVGREYYLIPDDPFDSPAEVLRFALKLAAMETSAVIRFGAPLDLLGNAIDADGTARDGQGRAVQTREYLEVARGVVQPSGARDREYTRQAGEALVGAFVRETVVMPTHFLAHVLMRAARRAFPSLELVRVLRFAQDLHVPWDEVNADAGALLEHLRQMAAQGEVHLEATLARQSAPELIEAALRMLAMYHSSPAALATGQGVRLQNLNVLCYYSNRLNALKLPELG